MARGRSRGTKKIDFTQWEGDSGSAAAIASAGTNSDTLATSTQASTLLRTRGEIVASIDGPTDGDRCSVACGILVATEEQVAVGSTAMPDPAADLDADWLWHGYLLMLSQAVTELSGNVTLARRLTIDSKAMRRMHPTTSLVMRVTNTALTGTPAVDVVWATRHLFGF